MPLFKLLKVLKSLTNRIESNDFVKTSLDIIINRLNFLIQTGLGYIKLNRVVDSLSAGEAQRIRLAGFLGSELSSLTILLDEPSRGLHPTELAGLQKALEELRDKGNTIIIVEHDMQLIKNSDYLIDMGPGAGIQGGFIKAKGKPSDLMNKDTLTAKWMKGELKFTVKPKLVSPKKWLEIIGATENNLKGDLIKIPHNCLVGICGVSGSGKSTLIMDTLGRALSPKQHTTSVAYEPITPGKYEEIKGKLSNTVLIDQAKENVKRPLKFLKLEKDLVKIYADSEEAQLRGYTEKILNKKCSTCRGKGIIKTDMGFLPDIIDECEACDGTGYAQESWEIKINGHSLPELNYLTFHEVFELFSDYDPIKHKINLLNKVGLGYLVLNQPIFTLSGGEVQRLKIVKELMKKTNKATLYILDEPTVGQHSEDISRLIKVLRELVQQGHTVVVVEHHTQFLASCDWVIELGPVGGPDGGYVIASGPPSKIANLNTPTATYIKEILEVP
jgi:excinuclease ABC subunit A